MINQVYEFNRVVLNIPVRPVGFMPKEESDHLVKAMIEEVNEFEDAIIDGDFIGTVDAIVDLLYFAMGGLYKMGISPAMAKQIFTAVHEANMEKRKGVIDRRNTGAPDAVKPEGWIPPEARIAAIIDFHTQGQ